MKIQGNVLKLRSILQNPVQYSLPIGDTTIGLNEHIGKVVGLEFLGEMECIHCQRKIKKSYSQGYCFPCAQTLARCDLCIVRPETCHYHLGTCREPEWGEKNCFIPHIVYLSNTSGLKVGITRETQVPTRWIDQGAIQALPYLRVLNRYQAGLAEVQIKQAMNDKTNWRRMLTNIEPLDFLEKKSQLDTMDFPSDSERVLDASVVCIEYPLLSVPPKITSLNLTKTPKIEGTLLGVKGQYLIFDIGVLNVRNLTGYRLSITI